MGPASHIPGFLNGFTHFSFRFPHSIHKVGARVTLAEKCDGIGEAIPVSFPFMRARNTAAAVLIEQLWSGKVNGHTDLVCARCLEIQQIIMRDNGRRNQQRHGDVETGT